MAGAGRNPRRPTSPRPPMHLCQSPSPAQLPRQHHWLMHLLCTVNRDDESSALRSSRDNLRQHHQHSIATLLTRDASAVVTDAQTFV
ncbi:hypothetical protein J1614_009619 [Plenodomus biglobosus]|nr:hypothetical protein J1614_009619 [Plenodomus biglobosus]